MLASRALVSVATVQECPAWRARGMYVSGGASVTSATERIPARVKSKYCRI